MIQLPIFVPHRKKLARGSEIYGINEVLTNCSSVKKLWGLLSCGRVVSGGTDPDGCEDVLSISIVPTLNQVACKRKLGCQNRCELSGGQARSDSLRTACYNRTESSQWAALAYCFGRHWNSELLGTWSVLANQDYLNFQIGSCVLN